MEIIKKIASVIFAPILEDGKFSMGRWCLTITVLLAAWKWAHGVDIPTNHLTAIAIFAGYVFGTKGLSTVQEAIAAYKEAKTAISGDTKDSQPKE